MRCSPVSLGLPHIQHTPIAIHASIGEQRLATHEGSKTCIPRKSGLPQRVGRSPGWETACLVDGDPKAENHCH